jgi:hypothetical protein
MYHREILDYICEIERTVSLPMKSNRGGITKEYKNFIDLCNKHGVDLEFMFDDLLFTEIIFCIKAGIGPTICNCGTMVRDSRKGRKWCSFKCRSKDKKYRKSISSTKTALYEDEKWKEGVEAKKVATCKKNNGVDYPMQNVEIFEKQQAACFEKDENGLHGYEPYVYPFLKNLYPSIQLGSTYLKENNIKIKWFDNEGKQHYSYPDFYSPEMNTFIEVKSDFTLKEHFYKIMKCKDSLYEMGYGYVTCLVKPKKKFEFTLYNHEYIEDN